MSEQVNEPIKEPLTTEESDALHKVLTTHKSRESAIVAKALMRLRTELLGYYEIDRANDELMARGLHAVGDE